MYNYLGRIRPLYTFLYCDALRIHTCIYGNGGVLSGKARKQFSGQARKQVFQTPEDLAASISTEWFHPSGGGVTG